MEDKRIAKYTAAIETHRHCDTVSMALVAGMLATCGSSMALFNSVSSSAYACYAPYVFAITAIIATVLYCMYRRSSEHSRIARNVARCLAFEDGPGISYVLFEMYHGENGEKERLKKEYGPPEGKWWNPVGIRNNVKVIWLVLMATMVMSFCLAKWK